MLLICVGMAHGGEEEMGPEQQAYNHERQMLINSFNQAIADIQQLRSQFSTDQEFDRVLSVGTANVLIANAPQGLRNFMTLILIVMGESPSDSLRRVYKQVKFFHDHPYDDLHGEHLMRLMQRYLDIALEAGSAMEQFHVNIQNVPNNRLIQVTLIYLTAIKELRRQLLAVTDEMALF